MFSVIIDGGSVTRMLRRRHRYGEYACGLALAITADENQRDTFIIGEYGGAFHSISFEGGAIRRFETLLGKRIMPGLAPCDSIGGGDHAKVIAGMKVGIVTSSRLVIPN